MKRLPALHLVLVFAASLWSGAACAQASEVPGPVGGVPAALPEINLPNVQDLRVAVPRQVRAAQAIVGLGRQRLALVLGLGTVGNRLVVDSAPRDAQAVSSALRNGGFIVMLREDVSAADLRSSLKEFRDRLQPGGVGFVYVTGLAAQVDGKNLLLPRDTLLDATLAPAALAQQLRSSAVPLDEVTDALLGAPDSPRMLVVDAAYRHPALARLPQPGLAEQKLPPGLMALFGHALGAVQEVPAVAPLPIPAPTDPAALAATPFVRVLVTSLQKARISGPEALRATRRSIVDTTLGQSSPWLGGDTDGSDEFAEATLLDGLVPRTPEEAAREAMRHAGRLITRPAGARAGEQSVDEVLRTGAPTATPPSPIPTPTTPATPTENIVTRTGPPDTPGASSLASTLGTAAGVVGTAASVAASVGAVGAAARAAEMSAAVSVATTAASSGASLLGNAVALAARAGSSDAPSPEAARQAARSVTATAPAAAPVATPGAPPAASPAAAPIATTATAPAAVPATLPVAPSTGTTAATSAPPPAAAAPVATPVAAPAAAPAAANLPAAAGPAALADASAAGASDAARRIVQAAASTVADQARAPAAQQAQALRDPRATDGRTQRSPDGGERPVYAPRTNSFGYAEGDTFTYQVIDTWKGEVMGQYTTAIEEVLGNGHLLANGHLVQMDPQGRLTRLVNSDGSVSEFLPSQDLWWANPQRGESRAVKFMEKVQRGNRAASQTEWTGSTRVGRPRKIATPAGEFEVLPVQSSGWWTETLANGTRNSGQWTRTVYYAPKLGHPVAIDVEDADRVGKLQKRERVELMHAQQARSAP